MVLEEMPLEAPVPIGAVGPTETVLLEIELLERVLLVLLTETTVDEEMIEELEVTGTLLVLLVLICEEVMLDEVETPVVRITEEEMKDEEVVLFAVTIFELDDMDDELVDGADEVEGIPLEELLDVLEVLLEEIEVRPLEELLEVLLEEAVDATLLLLLELVGASLILRAPLTCLLVEGVPSFFFM